MKPEPRSILAIDASPFGRALSLLPAMRAIRAAYPKTFITLAAAKGICELLAATGIVDKTIELGVIKSSDGGGAVKRLFQLARHARRLEFDLVLDFAPRMESQMLSRVIIRARTVTPSKLQRVVDLLWGSRSQGAGDRSDYASVLSQIDVKMSEGRFGFALPDEENTQFEKLLAKHGSRGGEPIALLYSSGREGHAGWPAESFAETAARLANNFGARIIVADEPADKSFTSSVSALLPKGAIKLSEPRALLLAAAVARASLVITDERGLAQMAAEFSTPVVEISDIQSAAPVSKSHRIIYGASKARVTTDEVYEVACELLQDSRSFSLFER